VGTRISTSAHYENHSPLKEEGAAEQSHGWFLRLTLDFVLSRPSGLGRQPSIPDKTVGYRDGLNLSDYTVKKASDFPVPSRDVTNKTFPSGE
jgi:hypothetical protein